MAEMFQSSDGKTGKEKFKDFLLQHEGHLFMTGQIYAYGGGWQEKKDNYFVLVSCDLSDEEKAKVEIKTPFSWNEIICWVYIDGQLRVMQLGDAHIDLCK